VTIYDRAVSFEDVDAAGIVFFARYFGYCHEAMERFFGGVPGGYVGLITKRRIGFPTVHLETDYTAPLRYGDVARIAISVAKLGTTSCTFRYDVTRTSDGAKVASITQVVVSTNLDTMTKLPMPPDCRSLLAATANQRGNP
jgi:4-hydroxybenzoyl-CoA thioesterase